MAQGAQLQGLLFPLEHDGDFGVLRHFRRAGIVLACVERYLFLLLRGEKMPIVTKRALGEMIATRFKDGRKMAMRVKCDGHDSEYSIFTLWDAGEAAPFATMAINGDYREAGTEANGLYSCFKYFFKIEEKEEE